MDAPSGEQIILSDQWDSMQGPADNASEQAVPPRPAPKPPTEEDLRPQLVEALVIGTASDDPQVIFEALRRAHNIVWNTEGMGDFETESEQIALALAARLEHSLIHFPNPNVPKGKSDMENLIGEVRACWGEPPSYPYTVAPLSDSKKTPEVP